MGLFSCCLWPSAAEPVVESGTIQQKSLPLMQQAQRQPDPGPQATVESAASSPAAEKHDSDWSSSWSKLNQKEATAVQRMLLKVSELIERFAEGSAEREAPVHALKKALQLVATDCHASYASMSLVSLDQQTFLVVASVGSSHEAASLPNLPTAVAGSGSSVEHLVNHGSSTDNRTDSDRQSPHAGGSSSSSSSSSSHAFSWSEDDGRAPPSDWLQLQAAGIRHIHAVPVRSGPEQLLGVLNLGFKHEPCLDMRVAGPRLFSTYMSLVSATLTAVVRDPGLDALVCLARDLAAASSLDAMMQAALLGSRAALTCLQRTGGAPAGGGACGAHTWLRLALISGDKSAAALYDDLGQAGVRARKRSSSSSNPGSSSAAQWVAAIQAAGGLVRTAIPMKHTILAIALANKKQVLIPDVQKLINQLGNINTDLFASKLLRPPSSVLLLPLRAKGVGIFGALYCLADVHTEFPEVAQQLKEVAELLGAALNRQLAGALAAEYAGIQQLDHKQLLARESIVEPGSRLGGLGGCTSHGSGVLPGAVSPSTATPATTAASLATGGYSSTTACSSLTGVAAGAGRSDGSFVAAATASGAMEFGSTIGTASMHGSCCSAGASSTGAPGLGRGFMAWQVASSTSAVAAGITEKLNQKRIDAAMREADEDVLGALQLVAQVGEGGFAKVFRGLYRGLVVAVKVVAVGDASSERAVLKNAHEIAILRSTSHPNIIQAYSCMTDVRVQEVAALCTRQAPCQQRAQLIAALTAGSGSQQQQQQQRSGSDSSGGTCDDATCHIQVMEYCDLGNLTSAIRSHIFSLPLPGAAGPGSRQLATRHASCSSRHGSCESRGGLDSSTDGEGSCCGDSSMCGPAPACGGGSPGLLGSGDGAAPAERRRVNMRWLLLTLLEVAEGMAYLHRLGVVHCDLKPANVLLKSSNADVRGFSAKVGDFGLSRVEDDDACDTFPFNSCGTAAYVAPEALLTTKKVNASVDVYAFGVIMWELFVGRRPYGNMRQQKALLHMCEESEAAAAASCSLTGSGAWGDCGDGLATPHISGVPAALLPGGGLAPAGCQRISSPGGDACPIRPSRPGIPRGCGGSSSAGDALPPAAAAALAEAAAAWNRQRGGAGGPVQGRGSCGGSEQPQQEQAAAMQLQAAQVLQWEQQQPAQHAGQHAHRGGPLLEEEATPPAVEAAPAAGFSGAAGDGGGNHQRTLKAGQQDACQQQAAAAAALVAAAAAGSVYEYQQVGFDGEVVTGVACVGASRHSCGGGGAAVGKLGGAAAQQQLPQAAAAACAGGVGGDVCSQRPPRQRHAGRPPMRSKTFTAGSTSQQQQYEQLLAANAAAGAGSRGRDTAASGSPATSICFGFGPGTELQQQQQQAAQQMLLQRQQQLMAQHGGYNSAAGVLCTQQRQLHVQQQHFAIPVPPGFISAKAAIVALQQQLQQQQHQLTQKAERELLAKRAHAAGSIGSAQRHQRGEGTQEQ
ncbi:hypothetical protein COO60DRAFT_397163 [Scenedesmus sp. NREL 46B-D3]|nr:hypothetical protein COO60DRAFT_397163 [Scenedesmus sp. NREL 46B-D3]